MESRNTIEEKLYSIAELAEFYGTNYNNMQLRLARVGINSSKIVKGRKLFSASELERLKVLRTIEVKTEYHIYESKMNYL